MSDGETATRQALMLDIERNRAERYANMLIFELASGGYIADRCRSEAVIHLAELFRREGVEITAAEQRKAMA